jgi:hypothetical protein
LHDPGISGNAELDARTCEVLVRRARFSAARNAAGKPTSGTWASSVRWRIPQVATPVPSDMTFQYRFVVEANGRASTCEMLVVPDTLPQGADVDQICTRVRQETFAPALNDAGLPGRAEVTYTQKVERRLLTD